MLVLRAPLAGALHDCAANDIGRGQLEAAVLRIEGFEQPPLAVEGAKRAVNVAGTVPTREGLRIEAEGQAVCLRSDDMKEALAAFVEQRPPSYQRR